MKFTKIHKYLLIAAIGTSLPLSFLSAAESAKSTKASKTAKSTKVSKALFTDEEFATMIDNSFQSNGIADKSRMTQSAVQKACSQAKLPSNNEMAKLEAEEMKMIVYPTDGKYLGDWKEGEKIAISGRGLTWSDKTPKDNGGGCYNCHQLSHKEIAFGTIGPTLQNYGVIRGNSEDMLKYTWGKIYNAKAYNACSHMPRNGVAEILTEDQIRHVMAFLLDPESPVNKK